MTTATCDHITEERIASEQNRVRHKVACRVNQLTDDGAELIDFMLDTVRGEFPDAKFHHRQRAAINLSVMGGQLPEDTPGSDARVVREKNAPKPQKPKITMKEIVNWEIGRATREQTDDCRDLIDALYDIMHPPYIFPSANPAESKYQKAAQVRPHHQMAAVQEMVKRGFGSKHPDCQIKTSYLEERMLQSRLGDEIREIAGEGVDIVTFLLYVIYNPKLNGWGEIIEDPYTQTHRLWSIKHLLWRGIDIPWDHITHDDIEQYYRDLDEKQRQETDRRLARRKTAAPLTPEQEAEIRALFEKTQRQADHAEAKATAKAANKANKAANRATTANKAALDTANKTPGNNATANGNNVSNSNAANGNKAAPAAKDTSASNGNATTDTPAPTGADANNRGPTAVANALARHPQVNLDTALQNHHATAGIPKQNLTHAQIYDAITAEANFQKRQAIIQSRLRSKNPDAAPDYNDPPKSRSP